MELSPTARVLLGMIRKGGRTGYEIKQLVDRSTRFFWAASYGQIYPELRRLEEEGLIEGEDAPNGGAGGGGVEAAARRAQGARGVAARPGDDDRVPRRVAAAALLRRRSAARAGARA